MSTMYSRSAAMIAQAKTALGRVSEGKAAI